MLSIHFRPSRGQCHSRYVLQGGDRLFKGFSGRYERQRRRAAKLRQLWKRLNSDGEGNITADDLSNAAEALGKELQLTHTSELTADLIAQVLLKTQSCILAWQWARDATITIVIRILKTSIVAVVCLIWLRLQIIAECDTDGDGQISLAEFQRSRFLQVNLAVSHSPMLLKTADTISPLVLGCPSAQVRRDGAEVSSETLVLRWSRCRPSPRTTSSTRPTRKATTWSTSTRSSRTTTKTLPSCSRPAVAVR